jgi:hypothetical protein
MSTRLINILTFTNIAAGATSAQAHLLNIGTSSSGVPIIPDLVEFDNSAFDMVSCTSTTLTVINRGGVTATANVRVSYDHSIQRAYGATSVDQLSPAPFVVRGSTSTIDANVAGQMSKQVTPPQVIAASTLTTVDFDTADFTTSGALVDLANNQFLVPVNGIYEIAATIGWAGIVTGAGVLDLDVFVNASGTVVSYITLAAEANGRSITAVCGRQLVAGDTISFRVNQTTGGPWNIVLAEATIYRVG